MPKLPKPMNQTRTAAFVTIVIFVCTLGGCATAFNNKSEVLCFSSAPDGAVVRINGHEVGVTPVPVELVVLDDLVWEIEGATTISQPLGRSMEIGWVFLDVISFLGLIIDAATNNWACFEGDQVHVDWIAMREREEAQERGDLSNVTRYIILGEEDGRALEELDVCESMSVVDGTELGSE